MCGRFSLSTSPEEMVSAFHLPEKPDLGPRYNVAPSQLVAVIGRKPDGKTRGLAKLRWGFLPSWANSPESGPKPINAEGGKKVPHHFRLKSREPFAFAGVWDAYTAGGKPLLTCAIITVPANALVKP